MDRKIIVTADNSKTLLIPELNETYHSKHGALNEARYVFIKMGLDYLQTTHQNNPITIFEMGFGTGLNALVTLEYLKNHPSLKITYDSIEKYPLTINEIENIGYDNVLDATLFKKLHICEWNKEHIITDQFQLKKIKGDIKSSLLKEANYDLIYFDAFGPRVQPALWETDTLKKMYTILKPTGTLVTYCAQGQFKRNLKAVGFEVQNLPGPPGKREMTRATKSF